MSNATVLNVPDLSKTKSKLRDIRSPTVEARCTSVHAISHSIKQEICGGAKSLIAKKEHTNVSNATSHLV